MATRWTGVEIELVKFLRFKDCVARVCSRGVGFWIQLMTKCTERTESVIAIQ